MQLGARETSWGAAETVVHEGKLLALELLTRVLCDPLHDWLGVRPEFAGELRAPLCLVLLRNCMSPFDEAVRAAVRLLCALAAAPRLRAGLRAELGALYPLLLLRPLEAARSVGGQDEDGVGRGGWVGERGGEVESLVDGWAGQGGGLAGVSAACPARIPSAGV